MTVLPWPGDRAWSAPSPAASSIAMRMMGGVSSFAWKTAMTSAPRSPMPLGTAATVGEVVPLVPGSAAMAPTGCASGTTRAGSTAPPGVAFQPAPGWLLGVESRSVG